MNELIWLLTGLLVGGGVGAAIAWWMSRGQSRTPSYKKLQKEQEEFKEEVTDHFVQTAQLINQLTDSYKAIFEHLSEGADNLVDPETLRQRLPATGEQEVKLRRIGASSRSKRKSDDADTDDPIGI